MRLLPATGDTQALEWLEVLTMALIKVWSSWGDVRLYRRYEDTWNQGGVVSDEVKGNAIVLRGFGVKAVVEGELGFQMHNYHSGPDLVCNLVRVEQLTMPLDGDVIEHLTGLDQAWDAWCEARKAGESLENPRPQLEVLRRIGAEGSADPETGVLLTLDRGEGDKPTLKGLKASLSKRLLSRYQ